jgi:DNA-binding transcriptional LysR family regulator
LDRLEAMTIFVAAVETGSFTAASRRLGVPLPTVSRKVADLETHLNARLLIRTTRKLTLTDAGEAYLAAARKILDQVGEAERAASGEYLTPRGDLAIAAPIVFGRLHVLPIVNAFLAAFPEIDVQLALSDRNADLIGDQIDMAVRIGPLADSSMIAARVGSVRYVVCASPDFLAAHGVPETPDDLAALPCVTFGTTAMTSWPFASKDRAVRPIPVRSRLVVNTAEAAIDAAIAGVGIARVLSYQAAPAMGERRLRIVLAGFEPEPLPVHLVHPAQTHVPLKLRRFLEFAAPRLKKALAGIDKRMT